MGHEDKPCLRCQSAEARKFVCRGCKREVGPYCEECWLGQRLYARFEKACTQGKNHPKEDAK